MTFVSVQFHKVICKPLANYSGIILQAPDYIVNIFVACIYSCIICIVADVSFLNGEQQIIYINVKEKGTKDGNWEHLRVEI